MPLLVRDPLLIVTRVLLLVLLAGVALAAAFTALALGLSLIRDGWHLTHAAAWASWRPVVGQALALGALLLIGRTGWRVLQMVETVPKGEAFSVVNVKQLQEIAGLILGLQILGLLARLAGAPLMGDINGFDISITLSPGGVAVVLLLFILARVFRQGLSMRVDVEGTI